MEMQCARTLSSAFAINDKRHFLLPAKWTATLILTNTTARDGRQTKVVAYRIFRLSPFVAYGNKLNV